MGFFSLSAWSKGGKRKSTISRRPERSRPPRFLPRLEALEDRTVPSFVFQTLDDPNAFGGTFAESINGGEQIAGVYVDAAGYHGFLLSQGQYTPLDDPNARGGLGTAAYGLNDLGQIVGTYWDAGGLRHGFLLSGGQYTPLDVPNATETVASGLNDRGQIVGIYFVGNALHGFLLSGGQYTTLDVPNAVPGSTAALGINDSGQIVGQFLGGVAVYHGFLATPASTSGTVLVASAALRNTTSLGTSAVGTASTPGANHGDGQTTAIVTVPSPLRSSGDSATAAAAARRPHVSVDAMFARIDDLFGPITTI